MATVGFRFAARAAALATLWALAAAGTAAPLPDSRSRALLAALSGEDGVAAGEAADTIDRSGDRRYVAPLIELLRAESIGLAEALPAARIVGSLETLSGEAFGDDWPRWVEWYARTELTPPPGFADWKGELLAGIDPRFRDLFRDSHPTRIRVEEVVWGGVPFEGIPALDRPRTITAEEAHWLDDAEPVFGIVQGGEARAYPLRILDWHEMTNDVVGDVAFSLAYCTLCGAGVAFRGVASDGRSYDFGSSGFLMRSNKLMVDRQTQTLWNQLTGRPVLGPLAATDVRLEVLPVVVSRWGDWRAQHPGTRVLDVRTGHRRAYLPGAAYGGYFASEDTMFPALAASRRLPKKARVFALQHAGVPKAYPLDPLVEAGVVNDRVGGDPVAVVATRGRIAVEGRSLRDGEVRYDAGAEVRAYARGKRRFRPGSTPDTVLDSEGREWKLTEEALVAPDGERAPRLPGHLAYWFGWSSFYPRTELYEAEAKAP